MTETEFRKLKQQVENARTQAEQAKGAMSQLLRQLKEEFGCATLELGQRKLVDLEEEAQAAQRRFDKAAVNYHKRWKDANDD